MSLKDPLHDDQVAVLRWVADGCAPGLWEGHSHKLIARALESRRLVMVSRPKGGWTAQLLPAGQHYLDHNDYPPGHWVQRPGGRRNVAQAKGHAAAGETAADLPPKRPASPPRRTRPDGLTPTRQLLQDVIGAGGVLERNTRDDETNYGSLVGTINRRKMAPDGQHLAMYSGASYHQTVFRLVSVHDWQTASPKELLAASRVSRWHPVVAALRTQGRLDFVTNDQRRRAYVLLHCLAQEAEARGYQVNEVTKLPGTDYYTRRQQPRGLFMLSSGDFRCPVDVKQLNDRIPHVPTEKELAEAKKWSWKRFPPYDHVVSDRLALVTLNSPGYPSEKRWPDTASVPLEQKLGDLLAAFECWAVADEDQRERRLVEEEKRARQREREDETARAAYVEDALGKALTADMEQWELANRLRSFVAALKRRSADLPEDDARDAARGWVQWCARFIEETVDPLQKPIRRPEVDPPSATDIAEFRRRLGFSKSWW